jgi:cytochrome P450
LYGPEFAANPARTYEWLRQQGPIAPVDLAPGVPANLVVSYGTALEILRNPSTFPKDPRGWQQHAPKDSPVLPLMQYRPSCRQADGHVHARLRGAVTDSLARVDPTALRGYVERSADTLINRLGPTGSADLISHYASVLPLLVFNHLFGCPPDLGDQLVAGMSGIFDGTDAQKANAILTQAVRELIGLKRAHPGADVPSWLMAHPARLTNDELMHQVLTLMGAGTEPQANLIANALRLLLSDDRFAADLSGGSLPVEDALDEVLWTDPPLANFAITYPHQNVDLEGVRLPADEPVVISLAAANTDPSLTDQRTGNRAHLAFSAGPHTCPAQEQARLIAVVAIERILDGLPDMRLITPDDQLTWRPGPFHRALVSLPVRFPAVSAPVPSEQPTGDHRWNPKPAQSLSTSPAATSTPKAQSSANTAPRRWWSFLARWWHGH